MQNKNYKIFMFFIIVFSFFIINISCINNSEKAEILKKIRLFLDSNFNVNPTPINFSDPDEYTDVFITPPEYSMAVKRISLVKNNENKVNLFNTNSLVLSKKVDFINGGAEQLFETTSIPKGNYKALEFEIYYLQMKFPINNMERNIRIYLSDDEVSGVGKHHQGDITIIDDNDEEIGWFEAPANFDGVTPRPVTDGFASGKDPETGHDRGPFGDAQFWNVAHPEDIFIQKMELDLDTDLISEIKMTFNVKNTWFYDDVDQNGIFSPGPNPTDDANDIGKHWSPIFPGIIITTK